MARIIVIDDEEEIRSLFKEILELSGHEVVECSNGREGLDHCRKSPADLIVTDLFMPEKDGLETIREFKKEFPETKIIAISGGSAAMKYDYLPGAKRFGAHRTYPKPVDLQELSEGVQELLDQH